MPTNEIKCLCCALFSDRTLVWDRNNVTSGGFMDVANAMEK